MMLREELRHKRKRPDTVYFSPSSDPFQPVSEVLGMTYDIFKFLLESEIGVAFVTKGRIPERHRKLLAAYAPLVQGRIGVITLDPRIATAFEPFAATPEVRLAQAAELIAAGIPIEARLDPILPGVTDDTDSLESLCAALVDIGVRTIAASVLFLRPAVVGSLRRCVGGLSRFSSDENGTVPFRQVLLSRLLNSFVGSEPLAIHAGNTCRVGRAQRAPPDRMLDDGGARCARPTLQKGNSRVRALPASARLEIMDRLKSIARRYALSVLVCACKNPDISSGSCHISGRWRLSTYFDCVCQVLSCFFNGGNRLRFFQ